MDFDAAWDAWMADGHGDCGGWKYDPGPAVIGCACGTNIPFPALTARHQTAAAGDSTRDQRHTPRPRGGADEHGADPAPGAAGAASSPGAQPLPPLPGEGDPFAREVGRITDDVGRVLVVGVDYDAVTLRAEEPVALGMGQQEELGQLLIAAVWQAGWQRMKIDADTDRLAARGCAP